MASRDSPVKSHSESITDLSHSSNMFAAGVGEILETLVANSNQPNKKPIMVEYTNRVMAVGRGRLATMNGRVSSDLLNQSCYLNRAVECAHVHEEQVRPP